MGNAREQARLWVEEQSRSAGLSATWIQTFCGGNDKGAAASVVLEIAGQDDSLRVQTFGEEGAKYERFARGAGEDTLKWLAEMRETLKDT